MKECKCFEIKQKIRSVLIYIIIITMVIETVRPFIIQGVKVRANEGDSVTYTIDSTSEITYFPNEGPYGRIEYRKRHFTTGSGIRYYTREFVISTGKISESTDMRNLSEETSYRFTVSTDGTSVSKSQANKYASFYWYDSEVGRDGYITTTYSLDGKYFYNLMAGKAGQVYIHHVFAVTGGNNTDSWHTDNSVSNHKEFWKYSDLFKLWWNNTAATHNSQRACMNVLVPFERNVRFVTCYYDDVNDAPLKSESRMVNFFDDYENNRFNVIDSKIDPEIVIGGEEYEVCKKEETPFVYKWIKVPPGVTQPDKTYKNPVTNSYNSNMVDGDSIKIKAVTNQGKSIPSGKISETILSQFDLAQVSGFTWVIILYVPIQKKGDDTSLTIHFFDNEKQEEVGYAVQVGANLIPDKKATINDMQGNLLKAGLSDYEIDLRCGAEFTASGEIESIKTSLAKALNFKIGRGSLKENEYITPKLKSKPYNVVWIPVAKSDEIKDDIIFVNGDVVISYMEPDPKAIVKAKKGTDFDVNQAIPTTEYIYSEISSNNYLFNAAFQNITGLKQYPVTINLPYTIYYTEYEYDEDGEIIDSYTYVYDGVTTQNVSVKRPYSYWIITQAAYYKATEGVVNNASVVNDMKVRYTRAIPEFSYDGVGEHVVLDGNPVYSYDLPTVSVWGSTGSYPVAPKLSFDEAYGIADGLIPNIKVRNDEMHFGGKTVLDDEWIYGKDVVTSPPNTDAVSAPKLIKEDSENEKIPAEKRNITYKSKGNVTYELVSGMGASKAKLQYDIPDINSVNVHTPVVDDLHLNGDNGKYVQEINPDMNKFQLVVGKSDSLNSEGYQNSTNDFEVIVKHIGDHIGAPGYGLEMNTEKYVKETKVMFDFDVFSDESDKGDDDAILIKAGTWHSIYPRYYIPEWVSEGDYKVHTRTYALNSSEEDDNAEKSANLNTENYIAYSEADVRVSGKIYGLQITAVGSNADEWKNVFTHGGKIKNAYSEKFIDGTLRNNAGFDIMNRYYYMAGKRNELGIDMQDRNDLFIFPFLNGSSPKVSTKGLLKTGYTWWFKLKTTGTRMASEKSAVIIKPTFYWVDENGKNREKVDVWYSDTVDGVKYNHIKIGDDVDILNEHLDYVASDTSGIPKDEIELKESILGNNSKIDKNINVYTYGLITNPGVFKTFAGNRYADWILGKGLFNESKRNLLNIYEQWWYYKYSLPDVWHACSAGIDVNDYAQKKGLINYKEKFWKKNGFLIVNFEIIALDEDGIIMTYSNTEENKNNGMCDMWNMEGYVTERVDINENKFEFQEGDVFIVKIGKGNNASSDFMFDHLN